MNRLRLAWALCLATFVAACGNIPSGYRFDPDKPTGLVIGSVSYESSPGKYSMFAVSPAAPDGVEFAFGCTMLPCLPINDSDFSAKELPKQRGGGFAVEVPEGIYRIVGWRVVRGALRSRSTAPIDIEFTVERGKASCIGNLHFDADWEDVKLRDKAARDIPLLQGKYAVLKWAPAAYTIAPGVEIGKLGGSYQTRMSGPIFIPIAR
jgi:hypothetical protein